MKRSIISTLAAVAVIGLAGLLSAADIQAAEWPTSPAFTVSMIDDAAVIEEALLTPSIGRTVIYQATPDEQSNGAAEHPAVITRVWSETCVNLKVLPDCGTIFDKTSVGLDGALENATPGTWRWPKRVG